MSLSRQAFDLQVRDDFPLLVRYPRLSFLDTAATTQKPASVIAAEQSFYETSYANIHRAVYDLAAQATEQYEGVRGIASDFLDAPPEGVIVFTRNATEALNLAAWIESQRLTAGDEILLSVAEHHSNILPWRRCAERTGARLVWVGVTDDGCFDESDFYRKLSQRTAVVALTHVSNVLGFVAPLASLVPAAHDVGARVVIDMAQSAVRVPVSVRELGVDYAAFSGHKMYGPTGAGFLYAKRAVLDRAEPLLVGGGTVQQVTQDATVWQEVPLRFEAGTPALAQVVALRAALEYVSSLTLKRIGEHEQQLIAYTLERLQGLSGVHLYGPTTSSDRVGVFSFTLSSGGRVLHSHDVCQVADDHGVAVRGGHHCAQPLMAVLGVPELVRASLGVYSTRSDIDRLCDALEVAVCTFA